MPVGVIHKIRTLGDGRNRPAKSALDRLGKGRFSCKLTYVNFFSQTCYQICIEIFRESKLSISIPPVIV